VPEVARFAKSATVLMVKKIESPKDAFKLTILSPRNCITFWTHNRGHDPGHVLFQTHALDHDTLHHPSHPGSRAIGQSNLMELHRSNTIAAGPQSHNLAESHYSHCRRRKTVAEEGVVAAAAVVAALLTHRVTRC
jgi:hypothetical protein